MAIRSSELHEDLTMLSIVISSKTGVTLSRTTAFILKMPKSCDRENRQKLLNWYTFIKFTTIMDHGYTQQVYDIE